MLSRLPRVMCKVTKLGFSTRVSPAQSALLASTIKVATGAGLGFCLAVCSMDGNAPRPIEPTPRLPDVPRPLEPTPRLADAQDFSKRYHYLTSFIEHKEFQAEIYKCLKDKYRTMNVLWAPPGAGKTTYALAVCYDWQNVSAKTRKVFYVSDYSTSSLNDVLKDLKVKDVADLKAQLDHHPAFEVVLVLDSFDQAFEKHDSEIIRPWLLDLLEATSERFHVLCIMSKPHKAKRVLNWKQKIGLCGTTFPCEAYKTANFKWTHDQISKYVKMYGSETWTHQDKRNFVLACQCGNINFMNAMLSNQHWFKPYFWDKTFKRRLAVYEDRWKYGISVLSL